MTSIYTARRQLDARIKAFKRCIENNTADIEAKQAESLELQEKVDVIQKTLDLFGAAWTPKKGVKIIKKKKVAKKAVILHHSKTLDFALQLDATSQLPVLNIIAAFEESCTAETPSLSFQRLFQAINARRVSKLSESAVSDKLYRLRSSPHPELSSLFRYLPGNSRNISSYGLNAAAISHFKKLMKKRA